MRVIVVGAGLGGLLVGAELKRRGFTVTMLEASERVGGVAQTESVDGFMLEPAVSSFTLPHPALSPILSAVEVETVCLPAARRRLYSTGHGYLDMPTRPVDFIRTPLLTGQEKLRVLCEPLVRSATNPHESLAAFLRRRFGPGAGNLAAHLAASGVFGGHPDDIDAAAYGPLIRLESEDGSILRGLSIRRRTAPSAGLSRPAPHAPRFGMRRLADDLAAYVGDVRCGSGVRSVEVTPERVLVDGEDADAVVVTAPPNGPLRIANTEQPDTTPPELDVAVVFLGGLAGDMHLPPAFGILLGPASSTPIIGILSETAPGRAPTGYQLAKVLVGGARDPAIATRTDDEITARVIDDVGAVLGASIRPSFACVRRSRIPQYRPGHLARTALPVRSRILRGGWTQRAVGVAGLATDAVAIAGVIERLEAA